jgi:uncharacterized damage-inducible protein DinB
MTPRQASPAEDRNHVAGKHQVITDDSRSLQSVLSGWDGYQRAIVGAIAPRTPAELAFRPAPHLRSAGQIASHIVAGRISWFSRMDAAGTADLVRDATVLGSEDAIADDPAELVRWLDASWQVVGDALATWTVADLDRDFLETYQGTTYRVSHQWTLWRVMAHDLHHGGELAVTLGLQGIALPDLGDLGGHIVQPPVAEAS